MSPIRLVARPCRVLTEPYPFGFNRTIPFRFFENQNGHKSSATQSLIKTNTYQTVVGDEGPQPQPQPTCNKQKRKTENGDKQRQHYHQQAATSLSDQPPLEHEPHLP